MIVKYKKFINESMTVEVYECEDDSISVIPEDYEQKEVVLGKNPKFIRRIEGEDWNDCMRQHHEIMGWEPYVPF